MNAAIAGIAEAAAVASGVGGALAIVGGALALGLRHGIDWDHIAAITDITSTSATTIDEDEAGLTREPGLSLTDESHHRLTTRATAALPEAVGGAGGTRSLPVRRGFRNATAIQVLPRFGTPGPDGRAVGLMPPSTGRFLGERRNPLFLGTLYALGHATVVTLLGLAAIIASGFLPAWIDPVMARIVGATLLLLAAYLYYSVYRYFRGGGQFRIRSRWMLVFAGVRNAYRWLTARLHGHAHHEVAHAEQYGARTAYGIGLIHGIGAETGTQVLVIATAVGAGSKVMGVVALLAFVVGLLASNTLVTIATATGFVSARKRQGLYVGAGLIAATFSLVVGLMFLASVEGLLPDLDRYAHWIGGPR